jgi:hypothetical protein
MTAEYLKSQYFYRTVIFSKQGEKISLVDIHDPGKEAIAFEPWLGIVISLADGQHTIQELIDSVASRYAGGPPDELQRTLDSAIERLVEIGMVKMSDESIELPYYLSMPIERLDLERAKQLMAEDGHVPES